MQTFLQDIRFGARMLVKNRGVTIVAIVALTLGIGANTAIFSVVHAAMLRSLPFTEADQLAIVWEKRAGRDQNSINMGNFFDWKDQNTVFTDMAAFFDLNQNLTGDSYPEEVTTQLVTTNFFSVLQTKPLLGRAFLDDDGKQGQPGLVIISHGLWQRRYAGDRNVIGRQIMLDNQPATVIGVMPADFNWFIRKSSNTNRPGDIWLPWQVSENTRQRRGRFAKAIARLKPGVTYEQAQNEMTVIGSRLEQQYPQFNTGWNINVVPLRRQFIGNVRKPLFILLGAVGFVLLIACANVANLLLARATARRKEIALRAGLGAGRWRIARQLLTESLLLSLIGGLFGLLVAWWGTQALASLSPPELSELTNVSVSLPVLGFTIAVTLLTGVVFGLVPALEATRYDLNDALKEGGRTPGSTARSKHLRSVFVVTQVALALVLLIGAGLLLRSLNRLQSVAPGFNPRNVLSLRVTVPDSKYDNDQKIIAFFRRAVDELKAVPGVEAAGAIDVLPFGGHYSGTLVEVEGEPKRPEGQGLSTGFNVTDANYFAAMQIPLKQGRWFSDTEATEMRHVVIVNEAFVRKNLPGQNPIGKRVTIHMKDDPVPTEIIGVVGDHKHMGLDTEIEPMSYWPHAELAFSRMTLIARTRGDAASFAPAARNVIAGIDPDQPVGNVATLEELLAKSIARSRFNTTLLLVFAGVALVMAAVGIYGVMSYSVVQRTHEIGVRMALGAQRGHVVKLVVSHGVVLGLIGVGVGLAASFGLTQLLASMLFEVPPTDAITFAAVAFGLFTVTLVACLIPARRALRVDPLIALRYE